MLKTSLSFANEYQNIPEEDIRIINHCRKSLLFSDNQHWKKKDSEGCFDVTMGSYDGAKICELVGIYILSRLSNIIDKNDCGLYRDDSLLVLRNANRQKIDRIREKVIQLFKGSGFLIDIETNLKIVNFLDITFNLSNGTFKPYKKTNDSMLYIQKSSNHLPQIIKQLPKIISDRRSKNSSNEENFNESKGEYENALKPHN